MPLTPSALYLTRRKGHSRRQLVYTAATLTSISMVPCALAEQPVDTEATKIKTVIVTATRMQQDVDDTNRAIVTIDRKKMDQKQPQSVAQALDSEPNINVSGGPRANNQTVNIRGLSGNKVLQTVDGVRQTFESGHRPSYFLDPDLISSVEAVKGPASSLWGSGAVGGVVAQNTISASDILEPDQELGGFVKGGFNANNNGTSTTAAMVGRTDSVDWLISGYHNDSDNITMGNGEELQGSGSKDYGFMTKAQWQIDEDQSISFNYRESFSKGYVPSNGSAEINDTSNYMINRDAHTNNFSVDYRIDTESPYLNAQLQVYNNKVEMDEYRVSDGRFDTTNIDVWGINANNQSKFEHFSLFYGIDAYTEDFNAMRSGDNRPTPPDATSTVAGAFMQANIPLATDWDMDVGTRYDHFSTEASNLGESRSDDSVSPSIALNWQATNWLKMTLRHDQAFRAPSSEEMYSTGSHFCMPEPFGCNTFIPNPDLEAEKAANTELIARMKFNGVFADDSLQITSSIFENRIDDFIQQIVTDPGFDNGKPTAGYTTWVNVDDATIKGFEIAADYTLQDFNWRLSYGQARGKDNNSGEDLTGIPANTVTSDMSYSFLNQQWLTGFRVTHAGDQSHTNTTEYEGTIYDSYTVADIYVSYSPAQVKGLQLDLTVNNIGDEYYQRAWEELYEAGTAVMFSAKYSF